MTNYQIITDDKNKSKLAMIAIKSNNEKAIAHFINTEVIKEVKTLTVNEMKLQAYKAYQEAFKTYTGMEKRMLNYGFIYKCNNGYTVEIKVRNGMINHSHVAYTFWKEGKQIKASNI